MSSFFTKVRGKGREERYFEGNQGSVVGNTYVPTIPPKNIESGELIT